MNQYAIPLKGLPEWPLNVPYLDESLFPRNYQLYSTKLLNLEMNLFLRKYNFVTDKVSTFKSDRPIEHTIHIDNTDFKDLAKLIWMYGDDHEMFWYKEKTQGVATYFTDCDTDLKSRFITFEKDEVDIVHRHRIKGVILAQVAVPHNVVCYSGKRRSVTVLPLIKSKSNFRPVLFDEAKEILKSHIE